MPGSGDYVNSTRVSFTQSEGSSNLVARWQEGDQIQLYVKQDKKVYTLAPTKVQNISQDGKSCTFAFQLPSAVDAERPYTIYGLHDIEGAIADDVVLAKSQLRRVYWNNGDKALAPMWFQSTGGASSIYAQFKHLGTYEVLHLKNTSKVEVMFSHCGFDVDVPWYKVYENTPLDENYDPTQYVTEPGDANSTAYFVGPGTTARILSWYMPSGGLLTNAKLLAAIDNKQVTSSNSKSSKVQLQRGHAYHMYATWDGKELKFDQGDALWGELQLSTYSVQIPVGGDVEIQILNGSKQKTNLKFDIPDGVVTGPIFTGDASFKLHANKVGHTSVTVTDEAEKLRAVIEVEVKDLVPDTPADAIDLGLPSGTKWATCNIGANSPEEYGGYYAWGETEEKTEYTRETYTHNKDYVDLPKSISGSNYDVAQVKWGGSWRMPTIEEVKELVEYCRCKEVFYKNIKGKLMTGPNGKSIFFPLTGWKRYTEVHDEEWSGYYYSSSHDPSDYDGAYHLCFSGHSEKAYWGAGERDDGDPVRAVMNPDELPLILSQEMISIAIGKDGSVEIVSGSGSYSLSYSNASTVSVTLNGNHMQIHAHNPGSALITIKDLKTSLTSSLSVYVLQPDLYAGEPVDLGLLSGVKWATCNVGASSPEEYGAYFAWGETEEKNSYTWENYIFNASRNKDFYLTKYCTNEYRGDFDNKKNLDPEDDVAKVKCGSCWRMPTEDDIIELKEFCTWEWVEQKGIYGYLITGPNGNSIFLPAAGYRDSEGLKKEGINGEYWSSNLIWSDDPYWNYCWEATCMGFKNKGFTINDNGTWWEYRCNGLPIRPVCDQPEDNA